MDSIAWEVFSGDMTVLAQKDEEGTALVTFGENFDGGVIIGLGYSPSTTSEPLRCSAAWEITLE
ncbi:hypothetical protein [Croceiramulus getboli]|nr:hypothetical protein P8624_07325 [Flavobacteriaceae bacterium YJPT1-3]